MTAMGVNDFSDGKTRLETFDFRTTTFYREFCEWVSRALGVELRPVTSTDDAQSYHFDWQGRPFLLAWADEYGCHIEGQTVDRELMRKMYTVLRDWLADGGDLILEQLCEADSDSSGT
jgi:hypothetical protein